MRKKRNIFEELEERSKDRVRRWEKTLMRFDPEKFIEHKLREYEKFTETQISYCNVVETYLAGQRADIQDQIEKVLNQNLKSSLKLQNLSRIVSSRFSQNPLCTFGSIKRPPGGRFNFGQTTNFNSNYFQALYLAQDYETAFEETYHSNKESIGTFTHFKIDCNLDSYLDLREDKVIEDFFRVINTLKLPKHLDRLAHELHVEPIQLCTSAELLKEYIFSPKFKAWDTYLNQYSHSQWFGYYCHQAKIPGMIYPSIRNDGKFNVVIFYDNFEETDCTVQISSIKEVPFVNSERTIVTKSNFGDFQKDSK